MFQDVLLFLFFCLFSCFALNHNTIFLFALHLVFLALFFFCSCCFGILLFFWILATCQKHHSKIWKFRKPQNETRRRKTDILTRAVSTGVFTNSVFFLFCVSSHFACFAVNAIKIVVSTKEQQKTNKQKDKFKC